MAAHKEIKDMPILTQQYLYVVSTIVQNAGRINDEERKGVVVRSVRSFPWYQLIVRAARAKTAGPAVKLRSHVHSVTMLCNRHRLTNLKATSLTCR